MKIQWSNRRQRTGIIISIVVFLVALAWILWPYQDNFSYKMSVNTPKPSESQQLVDMNRDTIVSAASFETQPIAAISSKDELIGSLKAPIKVIVYENYADAFSASFASTTKILIERYGDKVVVAFRPFFLASEPMSHDAALAAICASKQGRFQEMRSLLLSAASNDSLSGSNLPGYAKEAGLNSKKFESCLNDRKIAAALDKSVDDARLSDVFGAPTVFINEKLIPGALPWEDYKDSEGRPAEGLNSLVAKELK